MTTSVKARVAAVFTAVALVLGLGATLGTDMANAGSKKKAKKSVTKGKYSKKQSNKNKTKQSGKITNGNNTVNVDASRRGGKGGKCLAIGSNVGGVNCRGGDVIEDDGGPGDPGDDGDDIGPIFAGNLNVQIPVNNTTQGNVANDADTGQVGSVS